MMEFLTLLAAPIVTALIAPVALEFIKRKIDQSKAEKENDAKKADKNQELADQLRDELREENVDLKKIVDDLEQRILEQSGATQEIEKWQAKFYAMRKDYYTLKFDLSMVEQELKILREKYDEYLEIKERAEQQCRRADEESG